MTRIPVAQPLFAGNESRYTQECIDKVELTHQGRFVRAFEEQFADYIGVKHAIATNNGTTALHLALVAAGVQPGEAILVPSLTYVATGNAAVHAGGRVFVTDVNDETWCMSMSDVASLLHACIQNGIRVGAVIPVHLYGNVCVLHGLRQLCREFDVKIIEDAAEAHGAFGMGGRVGSLGDAGIFSFYANKIITCGEGGMITTNDDELAERARLLRGHAMSPTRRYFHTEVGFNYRMTNIQAAIGLAQLEQIESFLRFRADVEIEYTINLHGAPIEMPRRTVGSVPWMVTVLVPSGVDRDAVIREMDEQGVETRPVFVPLSRMPMYETECPIADGISARGINLPTYAALEPEDVKRVCDTLVAAIERVTNEHYSAAHSG